MKKVVFYSPLAIWYPHFETELELIEGYLTDGWDVTILTCRGELATCAPNPRHNKKQCRECMGRFAAGLSWLGSDRVKVESFFAVSPEEQACIDQLAKTRLSTVEELKKITLEGSDIGLGVLSSIVSALREPHPSLEEHEELVRSHLIAAATVHYSLKRHLTAKRPAEFVVFNGRFAELRAALRVAKALKIDTHIHEMGGIGGLYTIRTNVVPHDLPVLKREIEEVYRQSELPEEEKTRIGLSWFEERRRAAETQISDQLVYTGQQQQGLLPASLSAKTRNVAIFVSSEDEFVAIETWQNPFYRNQNDGLEQILSAFAEKSGLKFFVRVHPNLRGLDNSQTRFLAALNDRFAHVDVIPAESPVCTYALIDACDVTLTFGSTVGIEALYRQKPSILMGRAIYEDLEGFIKPGSHLELVALLEAFRRRGSLPASPQPEPAVYKYGYYQKTCGRPFKWARMKDFQRLIMQREGKETIIKPGVMTRLLNKLGV